MRAPVQADRLRRGSVCAARSRALSPRPSTAAIEAESSRSTTRCWLTPAGESRAPARMSARASAARHSSSRLVVIGSLAILPPPCGTCGAICQRNKPATGRTGKRRRNRWIATIAGIASSASSPSGVVKVMSASSTPAEASARATSRTEPPATTWTKRAPTRRAARDRPGRRRLNRARYSRTAAIVDRPDRARPALRHPPGARPPIAAGLRLLAQRELHDRQRRAVARQPRDEAFGSCGNRKSLTTTRSERRRSGRWASSSAESGASQASKRSMSSGRCNGDRGSAAGVVTMRESAAVDAQAQARRPTARRRPGASRRSRPSSG